MAGIETDTTLTPESGPDLGKPLNIDVNSDTDASGEEATTGGTTGAGTFREGASKFTQQAGEKARTIAEDGKARAGGALDEVSRMMGDAASTVDEKLGPQYGQYARSAADAVAGFSDSLKSKDVEELLNDARDFVRKSPVVAIGITAALGFVIARVVKAGLDPADNDADRAA